jgi:hypothetical protein
MVIFFSAGFSYSVLMWPRFAVWVECGLNQLHNVVVILVLIVYPCLISIKEVNEDHLCHVDL